MLKNATALITGGAQGLGKGFAQAILEHGGKVSLLDIMNDAGLTTQNEFNAKYGVGSAMFIRCDVRKKNDLEGAFRKTREVFGGINIVVNNAGVATTTDDWERTIDINLNSVMRGCFLAAEYMSRDKIGGQIINIASAAGLTAVPFDPAYAASKHGVVGLSRSFALILRPQKISVKCLCPSFAKTNIIDNLDILPEGREKKLYQQSVQYVGVMEVKDVVAAFKALVEDDNANGAVMYVTPKGFDYKYPGKGLSKL